jgi:hypothetical protein
MSPILVALAACLAVWNVAGWSTLGVWNLTHSWVGTGPYTWVRAPTPIDGYSGPLVSDWRTLYDQNGAITCPVTAPRSNPQIGPYSEITVGEPCAVFWQIRIYPENRLVTSISANTCRNYAAQMIGAWPDVTGGKAGFPYGYCDPPLPNVP